MAYYGQACEGADEDDAASSGGPASSVAAHLQVLSKSGMPGTHGDCWQAPLPHPVLARPAAKTAANVGTLIHRCLIMAPSPTFYTRRHVRGSSAAWSTLGRHVRGSSAAWSTLGHGQWRPAPW